jgi:hypothetical protein
MTSNYLQTLPYEILRDTLFDLPIKDVFSLCSTDKFIQTICNDDIFWRDYIFQNYNLNEFMKEL